MIARESASVLRGSLVPIHRRAVQAITSVRPDLQDALLTEVVAVVTREQNPVVLQGALTTIYCLAVRFSSAGLDVQRVLGAELVSAVVRETDQDALRGALTTIYCLAAQFALSWDSIVRPAERLFPRVVRRSLAEKFAVSLRQ